MILLLLIVLLVAIAVSPVAPYARGWGYYPSGGLGLVLLILLVLYLTGHLGRNW